MPKVLKLLLILLLYFTIFSIGLYLILANKDWHGYVALISTPLLHTLIKSIDRYLSASVKSYINKPR